MMKKLKCNRDCFNCPYEDCVVEVKTYSEKSLYKNRSPEAQAYQRAYQKRKRDEARAKGMCIVCRQKEATHGAKCYECFLRQKRHDRAKRTGQRQEWIDNDLCYYCGQPRKPGQKVCEKHYKILCESVGRTNAVPSEKMLEQRHRFYLMHR